MRKNKNTSKIILAVIVASLAMVVSYSGFKNMNVQLEEKNRLIQLMKNTQKPKPKNEYAYAVAKINLKSGEIISDDDIDFESFETIKTNAIDNRSKLVNKVLLKDIESGDVFTSDYIAEISKDDLALKEGYRALTLPIGKFQGQSSTMRLGSRVDIYSARGDSDWALENMKIIGINGSTRSTSKGLVGANNVTFEVATGDLSDFISNIAKGNLMLVARHPNDKQILHKKSKLPPVSDYDISSMPTLPPIDNLSGLPQPMSPFSSSSVEIIEANVKSQVTFD